MMSDKRNLSKRFASGFYILSIGVYAWFLIAGLPYYRLSMEERVIDEAHQSLRPAGQKGVAHGVAGFVMLALTLSYSIRKRTRLARKKSTQPRWLAMHGYFGIFGALFILLHASFGAGNLIAIGFWSMIIAVITGIFGRYFYLLIPRNPDGEALDIQGLAVLKDEYHREIGETLNLKSWQYLALEKIINRHVRRDKSALRLLLTIILNDAFFPWKIYRLRRQCAGKLSISEPFLRRTVHLAWRSINFERRVLLLNRTRQALHYWLVLHQSFALILYIVMLIHVGVALWLGYI